MKTLAIIIRSHGTIPIYYDYGLSISQILDPITIDYRSFAKIQMMSIVSLAKLGGSCYGDSDINAYSNALHNMREILYQRENVKNTEDLVNYVFGRKPKIEEIQILNQSIFNISYPPEIMQLQGYTLEKKYENDPSMSGLGVYHLSDTGFNKIEIDKVKTILKNFTDTLTGGPHNYIYKSQILKSLEPFNIFKLIFIDLSCYGYTNVNPNIPPLTEIDVNWLNAVLEDHRIKGGNLKKRKNIICRKKKTNGKTRKSKRNASKRCRNKIYKNKMSTKDYHKCVKMI